MANIQIINFKSCFPDGPGTDNSNFNVRATKRRDSARKTIAGLIQKEECRDNFVERPLGVNGNKGNTKLVFFKDAFLLIMKLQSSSQFSAEMHKNIAEKKLMRQISRLIRERTKTPCRVEETPIDLQVDEAKSIL